MIYRLGMLSIPKNDDFGILHTSFICTADKIAFSSFKDESESSSMVCLL